MARIILRNLAIAAAGVYATKVAPDSARQCGEPMAALTASSSTRSSNGLRR